MKKNILIAFLMASTVFLSLTFHSLYTANKDLKLKLYNSELNVKYLKQVNELK